MSTKSIIFGGGCFWGDLPPGSQSTQKQISMDVYKYQQKYFYMDKLGKFWDKFKDTKYIFIQKQAYRQRLK